MMVQDFFKNEKYINIFKKYLIITTFCSLFFLWGFDNFDLRLLIIPTFFFAFIDILKKKNNFYLFTYITILILIILHSILSILNYPILKFTSFDYQDFKLFGIFAIILLISIIYKEILIANFDIILKLFIIIFLIELSYILIFLPSVIEQDDNLFLRNILFNCDNGIFSASGFFFKENSHLGMIAAPMLLSFLSQKKSNNFFLSVGMITLILVIIVSPSTTFLTGVFVSSTLILVRLLIIRNFRKLIIFLLTAVISFSYLFFENTCNRKISQTLFFFGSKVIPAGNMTFMSFFETSLREKINELEKKMTKTKRINLSTQVFQGNLEIVKLSLFENKFIGAGINNYYQIHKHYKDMLNTSYVEAKELNNKDGSSNVIKILGEFGYFSLFFIFFFFYYFLKSKDELHIFIFMISIIVTQLFRGAGYYNGGFLVCSSIIIISAIIEIKKKLRIR